MANMIVSSSKTLIRATSSPIPPKPRLQIPQFPIPKSPAPKILLKSQQVLTFSSKTLKSPNSTLPMAKILDERDTDEVKEQEERDDAEMESAWAKIAAKWKEQDERDDAEVESAWADLVAIWKEFQAEVAEVLKLMEEVKEEIKRVDEEWDDADIDALAKDADFISFQDTCAWFFGGMAGFMFLRLLLELYIISSRSMIF